MIATYFPQISQISAENSWIFPADLADQRRKQPDISRRSRGSPQKTAM
jgi:hypothetical protein